MHIYPSAECVKSFDCDNKAYNFLALLTQLKRVIDRAGKERAGQGEGSHQREVRGIFTYATSKEKKGSDEAAAHNANNRKTRTKQADNEICWLSASGEPKKRERNTCTHVCMNIYNIWYMVYMKYHIYMSWHIYMCRVEYALRNAAQMRADSSSILRGNRFSRILPRVAHPLPRLENRVERPSCCAPPLNVIDFKKERAEEKPKNLKASRYK